MSHGIRRVMGFSFIRDTKNHVCWVLSMRRSSSTVIGQSFSCRHCLGSNFNFSHGQKTISHLKRKHSFMYHQRHKLGTRSRFIVKEGHCSGSSVSSTRRRNCAKSK